MNFKDFCNNITDMACVLSIEKKGNGYGEIRIVDGNDKYIDSMSIKQPGSPIVLKKFIPNSIYTEYIPRNLNFEQYTYKSAVNKELLHSYAYPETIGYWLHMLFVPLEYETKDLSYCLYIMSVHQNFDSEVLSDTKSSISNKVLQSTLKLSNCTDFKESLNNVVEDIRLMCDAKFCCILLLDENKKELTVLAENRDLNSGIKAMKEYMDMDPEFYDLVVSWKDMVKDNNCIIVSDKTDLDYIKERNLKWYESLIKSDVESLVLLPLKSRNRLLGFMWVSNFYNKDTVTIKEALEITTFILGSEIGNNLLLDELTTLSSIDLLTGVYNRNEMNNYMEKLLSDEDDFSIGLLFIDINGLKKVNDIKGHLMGDALIKRAADILKSIFDYTKIFRAGGDEFVIVVERVKEKELKEIITKIKEKATKRDVSLAIGYSIKKSRKEILQALKEADEAMYEDKRQHYNQK